MEKPFALSVKVLIVDGLGRCLTLKRSARSKFNGGKWDFPGGKVDDGESFSQALLREVEEETGLRIALDGVAGAAQSELPDRVVAYLIMRGQILSGEAALSGEHDAFAWLPPHELAGIDLCPQFRPFVESLAPAR